MPADAPRPAYGRWCHIESIPIALFCYVEQIAEDAKPAVLGSWLHQRGQVVGAT